MSTLPQIVRQQPPRPPRAKWTAYLFFVHENRERIAAEFAGAGRGEIALEVSRAWTKLTPNDRQIYIKKGEEDVKRYMKEQIEYAKRLNEYIKLQEGKNMIASSKDKDIFHLQGPPGSISPIAYRNSLVAPFAHMQHHSEYSQKGSMQITPPRRLDALPETKVSRPRFIVGRSNQNNLQLEVSRFPTSTLKDEKFEDDIDRSQKHAREGVPISSDIEKGATKKESLSDDWETFSDSAESIMSAGGLAEDGPMPYKKKSIVTQSTPSLGVELVTSRKAALDSKTGQLVVKKREMLKLIDLEQKDTPKVTVNPLEIGTGVWARSCVPDDEIPLMPMHRYDYHNGSLTGAPRRNFPEILRDRDHEVAGAVRELDFSYFEEKKAMMAFAEAGDLGHEKSRDRRRIWINAVPVNRVFFIRGCFAIAGKVHIVSVFGVGMDGRVYTAGTDAPKYIVVEAYDPMDSSLYELKINMSMLPGLLGEQGKHLLKPGHKSKVIKMMMKMVFFIFPDERPDPIGHLGKFALRMHNPQKDKDWIPYDERLRVFGVASETGFPPEATIVGEKSIDISKADASRYTGYPPGKSEAAAIRKEPRDYRGHWSEAGETRETKQIRNTVFRDGSGKQQKGKYRDKRLDKTWNQNVTKEDGGKHGERHESNIDSYSYSGYSSCIKNESEDDFRFRLSHPGSNRFGGRPYTRKLDLSGMEKLPRPETERLPTIEQRKNREQYRQLQKEKRLQEQEKIALEVSKFSQEELELLRPTTNRIKELLERKARIRATTAPPVRKMKIDISARKKGPTERERIAMEGLYGMDMLQDRVESSWSRWTRPQTRHTGITLLEAIVKKKRAKASAERKKRREKLRRKRERRLRRVRRAKKKAAKEKQKKIRKRKQKEKAAVEFQERIRRKRIAEKEGKPWPPPDEKSSEILREEKLQRKKKRKLQKKKRQEKSLTTWRRLKSGFSSKVEAFANKKAENSLEVLFDKNDFEYKTCSEKPVGIGWERVEGDEVKVDNKESDSSSVEMFATSSVSDSSSSFDSMSFDSNTTIESDSSDFEEVPLPTAMALTIHHFENFFNGKGNDPITSEEEERVLFEEFEHRLGLTVPKECLRKDVAVRDDGKKLRIEQIFKKLDEDKDGIINWTEWQALIPRKRLGISPGVKQLGAEEAVERAKEHSRHLQKEIEEYNKLISSKTYDLEKLELQRKKTASILAKKKAKKEAEEKRQQLLQDKEEEKKREEIEKKGHIDEDEETPELEAMLAVPDSAPRDDIDDSDKEVEEGEIPGACPCRPGCIIAEVDDSSDGEEVKDKSIVQKKVKLSALPWEMSIMERKKQRAEARRCREMLFRTTRRLTKWNDLYIFRVYRYAWAGKCFHVRAYCTMNSSDYSIAISFKSALEILHLPEVVDYEDPQWLVTVARMLAKKVELQVCNSNALGSYMRLHNGVTGGFPGPPLRTGGKTIISPCSPDMKRALLLRKQGPKIRKRKLRHILAAERFEAMTGSPSISNVCTRCVLSSVPRNCKEDGFLTFPWGTTEHARIEVWCTPTRRQRAKRNSEEIKDVAMSSDISDDKTSPDSGELQTNIWIRVNMPRTSKLWEFSFILEEMRHITLAEDPDLFRFHPLGSLLSNAEDKEKSGKTLPKVDVNEKKTSEISFDEWIDRVLKRRIICICSGDEDHTSGDGRLVMKGKQILKFCMRVHITQNFKEISEQELMDMYTSMEQAMSSSSEEEIELDDLFEVGEVDAEALAILARAPGADKRPESALREKMRRKKAEEEAKAKKEKEKAEFEARKKEAARQRRLEQGRDADSDDSLVDSVDQKSRLMVITAEYIEETGGILLQAYEPQPSSRIFRDLVLPDEVLQEVRRIVNEGCTARERDSIIIDWVEDSCYLEQQGTTNIYIWKIAPAGGVKDFN